MRILAIDPGSSQSAYLGLEGDRVYDFGIVPNEVMVGVHLALHIGADVVVIEWTAPRGMPASAELFETMWWAGRFAQAAMGQVRVERLKRGDVKRHLCGTTAATDTNVRAALIDRFGGVGGKAAAIGLKASPGPLYGVSKDVWAALAVAVTYSDKEIG
jgi:hypothetical protein